MEVIQLQENVILKEKSGSWRPCIQHKLDAFGIIIGKTLAQGEASKIKMAFSKRTNSRAVVKLIRKNKMSKEILNKFVWREVGISQCLEHESLLDIYHVLEDKHNVYIVMEYAANGSLLDFINSMGHLSESDARRIFNQLLNVVSYLHSKCVCHRDIKCDNILLDEEYNIKLADFGFVRIMSNSGMCETACGSYVYTAPEVLEGGSYSGIKADIWSMGVCLYAMLSGQLPFKDVDVCTLKLSMKDKLHFHKHLSKDCKNLLRKMLTLDPTARPDIGSIKRHIWMCKPLCSLGQSSMSSLSVAAVTSQHSYPEGFDPQTEHGYTCDQITSGYKSTRVSDVLRSVADNHSSGSSSIDLTEVRLPSKPTSNAALITGVSGPIGKRLSQAMGINLDGNETDRKYHDHQITGTNNKVPLNGKQAFGKAFKALRTFRCAAKVVTAIQRFRRKPLNTILTMPQDQAMKKMVIKREEANKNEVKDLHFAVSGKMASKLGSEKKKSIKEKRHQEEKLVLEREKILEKERLLQETLSRLLPPE